MVCRPSCWRLDSQELAVSKKKPPRVVSREKPGRAGGAPAAGPSAGICVPYKGQCLPEAHGPVLYCIELWQAPQGHRETLPCLSNEQKAQASKIWVSMHVIQNQERAADYSLRLGVNLRVQGKAQPA